MIEARNLTFGYSPEAPIITEWNAQFRDGEITAVIGASGRGKSTVLYLLGLLLRPSAGQLFVDGDDVTQLDDSARAALRADRFGFVFQDAALDPTRSVVDNVVEGALYRNEPRALAVGRARELLVQFGVGLKDTAKPGQLSGGQAQRIALCRALNNEPSIILADEPTGNLDRVAAEVVFDALRVRARRGALVVVVTHDPMIAKQCDRTLEI